MFYVAEVINGLGEMQDESEATRFTRHYFMDACIQGAFTKLLLCGWLATVTQL